MKNAFYYLLLILLTSQVYLNLSSEKRQELLNKLGKKIVLGDIDQNDLIFSNIEFGYETNSFQQMNYNVDEIKKLQEKYNLPENYNFFNDTGAEIHVKNQQKCGCCWSFAATSSLGYRYHKKNIKINLSPQDGLSCYLRDCYAGNTIIDAEMNLVKNGTVTEECFPFYNENQINIPQCPSKCEDEKINFEKYYARNGYQVQNNDQSAFKELVILIMDQLVTDGPIMGGFNVYTDFDDFGKDKDKCLNEVYTFNGTAKNRGGHAITIVGYGLFKDKFYWLIQNSWGDQWCDHGFIKMEIGQLTLVGFAEPYIEKEEVSPVEIEVKIRGQSLDCRWIINYEQNSSLIENWNDTLNIVYENIENKDIFQFQISKNKILGKNKVTSFYEQGKLFFLKKGKYFFKSAESLGNENIFKVDDFKNASFTYQGVDNMVSIINKEYYVSEKGSKIIFNHKIEGIDDSMPSMNLDILTPINCYNLKLSTNFEINLAYCEFDNESFTYLEEMGEAGLNYDYFCGYPQESDIKIIKLDTTKYPVFRIIDLFWPEDVEITSKTDLVILANVEGSTKFYQNGDNSFYALIEIENNNKNKTGFILCSAQIPFQENNFVNLTCHLNITSEEKYQYESLYLLPYSLNNKMDSPFEVIINETIKIINPIKPVSNASYLKLSLYLLGIIFLF